MGEQFITQRVGWTAQQLIASFDYVTGPFRDKTHHTPAEQDWFRGYTEPITRHLTQIGTPAPWPVPRSDSPDGRQAAGSTP